MKKLWLIVFAVLGLTGCREATLPNLHVEQGAPDSMHVVNTAPEAVQGIGKNVKIVTGVPATVEDKDAAAPQDMKDKPGAIAVKMEY